MLKKYNGKLGDFEYNDEQYSIVFDEDGEYCHYIGSDMENVVPPSGLKDYTGLYMGTGIVNPVKIEDGVVSTNSMYSDCKSLKTGSFVPDSVKDMGFMYDGCESLESIPNFSKNAVNLSAACANCINLKSLPPIPGSAEQCDSIALNCESLSGPVEIGYGVKDISCGFAGCNSLTSRIELPSSVIKSDDVFENCRLVNDEEVELSESTLYVDSSDFVEAYNDENIISNVSSKKNLTAESKQAMAEAIVPEDATSDYESVIDR